MLPHHPRIGIAAQSVVKAAYKTIGVLVTLFVIVHIANAFYISHATKTASSAFESGLRTDTAHLKLEGDAVSALPELVRAVDAKDRESILAVITREREVRNIGLMGVADKDGVILGRTYTRGMYGDNVFLTAPAGRVVSQGRSVESIELTGFGNQIFMTTARPVLKDGQMNGAVFANYLLDDTYAERFKKAYLAGTSDVAFYTKAYGIYGASFEDTETRSLVESYFNTGSDWVENGLTDRTITFTDGTTYLVRNIVFPGLEQSPGGALLFVPLKDRSMVTDLITAIMTLATFLFLAIRNHRMMKTEEKGWTYHVSLGIAALCVFGISFFVFYAHDAGRLKLARIPYTLYNSTLRFQPSSGMYAAGYEQRLTVYADTGDEAINVVDLSLVFDPEKVKVVELDSSKSPCTHVVESSIDQKTGRIVFTCGMEEASIGAHALPIVDIVVVPLVEGSFTINFDMTETRVLASDGLGTNVLRMTQDSTYRVENFDRDASVDGEQGMPFILFSPTHPNESRWYNAKRARFVWRGEPGEAYHYAFDASPSTIPTGDHTIKDSGVTVEVPGDGVYYFHLKLASGGPVAHYRIRSDRTPPSILSMGLSSDAIYAGDVVRFSFDATDAVSGVQKNYYVDLGNNLFLPIGQHLLIPFLETGAQAVRLRVYDNAGNYAEETKVVRVSRPTN